MPELPDEYPRLALSLILVDRPSRQRREIDTSDLEPSIAARGVLQPIIVSGASAPFVLIAGERRLEASRRLGLPDIPFRHYATLDPVEAQIIELEENIKRQDLCWQDLVSAVGRIHSLFLTRDPGWTGVETAEACGLTPGTISLYLTVHRSLAEDRIATASTVREAFNILARRDHRAAGDAISEILESVGEALGATPVGSPSDVSGHVVLPLDFKGLGPGASQRRDDHRVRPGASPRGIDHP